MDETDRQILDILRENGRASYTEVAEEVGVSEGTVRNRVRRMEEDGIIDRFTVETSLESSVEAFVMIELESDADPDTVFRDVEVRVHELAGSHDAVVRLEGESSADINDQVDGIRATRGIASTETYMVLRKH